MARTEQKSERKRIEMALVGVAETEKSLQNGEGFSGKNLNKSGLQKRKG